MKRSRARKISKAFRRPLPVRMLMAGRVSNVQPEFGELRVCQDVDGTLVAAFIGYESGRKHPLNRALLTQLDKPGQFRGWGHLWPERPAVFRFQEQTEGRPPKSWMYIDCQGFCVALRPTLQKRAGVTDGSWVACRVQRRRRMQPGMPTLTALSVSRISPRHPYAVQTLVSEGILNAEEHTELLENLLRDLEQEAARLAPRSLRPWVDTLRAVATVPGLPEDLRAAVVGQTACLLRQLEAAPTLEPRLLRATQGVHRQPCPEPTFARA